ncbi:MAG: MSMEG_0570 family nitrogen starvation response protein [Oleibacter sp.]|nr:MSMEG_0570 family nitrogen starvation response protein [Thalassolituus sp.]
MPAVHFYVRWPDGKEEQCYSPSTVINEHFKPGDTMPLSEFVPRAEQALTEASNRVAQRFGYHCTSAASQLEQIKHRASLIEDKKREVVVMSMHEI